MFESNDDAEIRQLTSSLRVELKPRNNHLWQRRQSEKIFFEWSRKLRTQEILTEIQADSPSSFREDIPTTRGDKGCKLKKMWGQA